MTRKIIDTSKTLREIHDTSPEVRLVDPKLLENALRAEGLYVEVEEIEKPFFLFPTLRKEILNRL